jgi:hypothetical protein
MPLRRSRFLAVIHPRPSCVIALRFGAPLALRQQEESFLIFCKVTTAWLGTYALQKQHGCQQADSHIRHRQQAFALGGRQYRTTGYMVSFLLKTFVCGKLISNCKR